MQSPDFLEPESIALQIRQIQSSVTGTKSGNGWVKLQHDWMIFLLDFRGAATAMLRDASQCRSPNSGWPMAAATGALGIRLEKRDTYVLNESGHSPSVDHLNQVVCMLNWALVLSTFLFAGIAGLLHLLLR